MNKRIKFYLLTYLLTGILASGAQAAVINFDDLTNLAPIPSGYGGINWDSNAYALDDAEFANSFFNSYGSPSGEFAAYNGFGVPSITISSPVAFDFNGASFTGLATRNSFVSFTATDVTVLGYNGATLVGSVSMALSANSYQWLQADLLGITSLVITNSNTNAGVRGRWWLMDDFTYNQTPVNAVPVPAAAWLFGSALVGMARFGKRKLAA